MATQIRGSQIMSGTIFDTQIAPAAAIATSKLADGANFLKRDGSVALTGNLNAGSQLITNVGTPAADTDAANKGYVDNLVGNGLAVKAAVKFGTTGNVNLTGLATQANGDWGSALTAGDRIMVRAQTDATQNGVYVAASGAWTRSADFNSSTTIKTNSYFFVGEGQTLADTGWVMTTDGTITPDVTAIEFQQFSSAGIVTPGNYLQKTGNILDVLIGDGLQGISNHIAVKAADATLSVDSAGVKLAPLTSAYILVGNGSNVATPVAVSGDATMSNTGALSVASTVAKYANFVFGEVPSGAVNGANAAFTLASAPQSGTVCVFLNGVRQNVGAGNDYTISGQTITFNGAPSTGDTILVDYVK